MEVRSLRCPIVGWVLLLILLLSTIVVVFHKDVDYAYNPSCPACQLASNPGSHTSAVSVATIIPPPVALSFVPDHNEPAITQVHLTLEFIPRSPPASL